MMRNRNMLKITITCLILINIIILTANHNVYALSRPVIYEPGDATPYFETYVKWTNVSGADHYRICVRDLNTNIVIVDTTVYSTQYCITLMNGITLGHDYRAAVAAIDEYGNSDWTYYDQLFWVEDTNFCHMAPGGFYSASNLEFFIDVNCDLDFANLLVTGAYKWNGVTDTVNASRIYSDTCDILIQKGYSSIPGDLGYTALYNGSTLLDESDFNTNFTKARIYLYKDNMSEFTNSEIIVMVAHEMGHSLSLMHTGSFEYFLSKEIMDTSLEPYADNVTGTTLIDRTHLRKRWGGWYNE